MRINQYLCGLLLVLTLVACEDDEPSIDWTQEEFYTPQTDQMNSDSLAVDIGDFSFRSREESIEEIAERLGLTPYPASDTLLAPEEIVLYPPPFSFNIYSAEVNVEGQVIGYLPGLTDTALSDSIRGWRYQSGRYIFRFQESENHRFVNITQKQGSRVVTESGGQSLTVATESSSRLFVNDEEIIDNAVGLKRDRLTFEGEVEDLSEQYPSLRLPPETIVLSDYRYDTILADSIDDGVINERRVRVILSVSE